MAEPDFEKVKKIVRSVLLPCQGGCTLREFLRSYRELNGINLPYGKLGFSSDLQLLQQMPDAVNIRRGRSGDIVLSAVADVSTQHIQKMVSKQKAPKKRPPMIASAPLSFSKSYSVPPRFLQKPVTQAPPMPLVNKENSQKVAPIGLQKKIKKLVSRFPSGLSLSQFLKAFEQVNCETLKFRSIGFFTLEECLETVPNIAMKTISNDIYVFPKGNENSYGKQSPVSNNEISGNSISHSQVKQSKIQETFVEKSSVVTNTKGSTSFSQVVQSNVPESRFEKSPKFESSQREIGTWKNISYTPSVDESRGASKPISRTNSFEFKAPETIPPFVLKNLQKLAVLYPEGIRATKFPSVYEDTINTEFDLHSLGYNDLSVFIDAVPDIFKRVEILGMKKNWLIVPANKEIREPPNQKALLHDTIISNIRTLLEANPEGISIYDFLHIYCLNCLEPLCISEFGFTSLESFLMNNANQVPLTIATGNYGKVVHLVQAPELRKPDTQLLLNSEPASDVILPGTDIFCVSLPADMDKSKFFPVWVASVETPSLLYIQLDKYKAVLKNLHERIESFYRSSISDLYAMKTHHVKVNTVCMALWPSDKLWYRVIITSIISLEEVQVFYFDYGTKDIIPVTLLRYMKKEFSTLPAQALLSNLACLKPANNEEYWSPEASDKLRRLTDNVRLMAKIYSISNNDILSLVLCDTNGSKDVFINDELLNAGLAEAQIEKLNEFDIGEEAQASENHLAVGFQALSMNSSTFIPPPILTAPAQISSPIPAPIPVPSYHYPSTSDYFSSEANCLEEASTLIPSDSEVFDDDDDDLFDKFYEEVQSSVMKRYVKRVKTVDAYIFHIICVEGKPFVSCGDICALIWDKREFTYLLQRLQNRQCHLSSLKTLESKCNTEMFQQLEKFGVKGINEYNSEILVCPLEDVIYILNLLGQPSADLRRKILYELENFNPSDPTWMELSAGQIPDKEEIVFSSEDDKLNHLCLYDLIAMKESIRLRSERVQNNVARGGAGMDEIMKMEQLMAKVVHRINQIKEVCQEFNL